MVPNKTVAISQGHCHTIPAKSREKPREGEVVDVVAGAAGMGATLTIAGETGIYQAGVVLEKLVWSEFHPLHHALKVERENTG